MTKLAGLLPGWVCAALGVWIGFGVRPLVLVLLWIFAASLVSRAVYEWVDKNWPLVGIRVADMIADCTRLIYLSGSIILSAALPTAIWLESDVLWVRPLALLSTFVGLIVAFWAGSSLNTYFAPRKVS
jgi:hypothetical protein